MFANSCVCRLCPTRSGLAADNRPINWGDVYTWSRTWDMGHFEFETRFQSMDCMCIPSGVGGGVVWLLLWRVNFLPQMGSVSSPRLTHWLMCSWHNDHALCMFCSVMLACVRSRFCCVVHDGRTLCIIYCTRRHYNSYAYCGIYHIHGSMFGVVAGPFLLIQLWLAVLFSCVHLVLYIQLMKPWRYELSIFFFFFKTEHAKRPTQRQQDMYWV